MKVPKLFGVIMAGGKGTRFWPLSRNARPKQLLKIIGDTTMLQMTVDRLRKVRFVEDIYVVSGPDLAQQIGSEIDGITKDNIIIEPSGKNTAPCIGLVAQHLLKRDPEAVMGVFPSDHIIVGYRSFSGALRIARDIAVSDHYLVTFGVVPSSPHTGYGYIQFDKRNELPEGKAFEVKTFAEKPTLTVARRFLKSGDFLWNSGMFVWRAGSFMDAMEHLMPEHFNILTEIGDTIGKQHYQSTLNDKWSFLSPESLDYGILERADNICVVRAEFEWNDVASWNSYYDILPSNGDGNVVRGDGIVVDGSGNLIHSNNKLTAVVGLDNVAVVNTPDATLVVSRDHAEEIKKVVELLQKEGRDEVL